MSYTVQSGDSLGAIAKRHHTSVNELQRLNGIADPNRIHAGQSLRLPDPPPASRPTTTSQDESESWSQTVLRFVDALGRPIIGLMVRTVAEGRELLSTTGADGCIHSLACKQPNASIDVHVQRADHKGDGEKHIGRITPSPGKQTVKVQSGKHVVTTKIRRHEGAPQSPPRQMKAQARGDKVETATTQGHPLLCVKGCECPNEDDLLLGPNLEYKEWVKTASKRAGILPQAVAAVMNAEASKLKDGKWSVRSESSKSSATGMTQFLDGTWIDEALRKGTYLNDKAKKEGWLTQDTKGLWQFKKADGTFVCGPGLARKLSTKAMLPSRRNAADKNLQKLLDLRYEAEFAIMAAMDYAKVNLDALLAKSYAIGDLNDTEKARIMYLCHHLGIGDAVHFIQNTIPEEDVTGLNKKGKIVVKQNGAQKLLTAQVGKDKAEKTYVRPNDGSWVNGHRDWLQGFMKDNITPSIFACPGKKKLQLQTEESGSLLLKITRKLKR